MIDAIRGAIGFVVEPVQIRRIAKARAAELKLLQSAKTEAAIESAKSLANLDADVLALLPDVPVDVVNRARQRVGSKELSRQINLDAIVADALDAMPESVSTEPVDTTWLKRFFDVAADVDDEKMQGLWGKILAGEVASPGTFSLRTVDVLRNLSQEEAELFVSACHLVMGANEYVMTIPTPPSALFMSTDLEAMEKFGIDYEALMTLSDAGLVFPELVHRKVEAFPITLYNNGRWLDFQLLPQPAPQPPMVAEVAPPEPRRPVKPPTAKIPTENFPAIRFTEAGKAIGGLVADSFNQAYVDLLVDRYKQWGISISLRPLDAKS